MRKSLDITHSEYIEEWNEEKNGPIKNYSKGSHKKVWWICKKDRHHEWETELRSRIRRKSKCPVCSNRKICPVDQCNSLFYNCDELLKKEWNEEKNGSMENYTIGSGDIVWWICRKVKHHEWKSEVKARTKKNYGCPICSNKKICPIDQCNSLYYNCNEITKKEWDEEKNGSMKKYFRGSVDKVWWICSKNSHHKWEMCINTRTTSKCGCTICSNRKICPIDQCNSLYYNCCNLVKKEWDENRNGSMKNYPPHTKKKVWWICSTDNNHTWRAKICVRNKKHHSYCPKCCVHGFSRISIQWLDYIANKHQINIIHAKNSGEYKIKGTNYKADGYCRKNNTIFSFLGCLWHGCPTCFDQQNINPLNHISFKKLYKKTIERENVIKSLGYNLITIWEHDFINLMKNNGI